MRGLENPTAMLAHFDSGNGQRNLSFLVNLAEGNISEGFRKGLCHCLASGGERPGSSPFLQNEIKSESLGKAKSKNAAAMLSIKLNLSEGFPRQRGTPMIPPVLVPTMRSKPKRRDQCRHVAPLRKIGREMSQVGGRIRAAHSAAIKTQHTKRLSIGHNATTEHLIAATEQCPRWAFWLQTLLYCTHEHRWHLHGWNAHPLYPLMPVSRPRLPRSPNIFLRAGDFAAATGMNHQGTVVYPHGRYSGRVPCT